MDGIVTFATTSHFCSRTFHRHQFIATLHVFFIDHFLQQEQGFPQEILFMYCPVPCTDGHGACCCGCLRNQLVHTAQALIQGSFSFVNSCRKLVRILDGLRCNLRLSLGFLGRMHLSKFCVKLLVHIGEVAVDLLKPLMQCRQGCLRQIPDFVVCCCLALVRRFRRPFSHRGFSGAAEGLRA